MSEPIIGSIGVAVVPNAEQFWERFKAQTQAGAEAAAPTVKVKADTSEAEAKIAELAGEAKAVSPEVNVKANTQDATRQINALSTAIITLGPATIPLAGGIAGLASSLVGLVPTAALAFSGIQNNMKAGTELGKQYTAQVDSLKQTLTSLQNTAASGVLTGFQQGVAKINQEVPQLNQFVGKMATLLGDIGSHLIGAVTAGFNTFEPLIVQAASAVDKLAGKFEEWASGPAGASFMQSLSQDMGLVLPILENLLELVTHLVAALAPIGTTILQGINAFATAVNAIPVPVLEAALTAFIGFKIGSTIAVGIDAAAAALGRFAVASEAVAVKGGVSAAAAAGGGALRIGAGELSAGLATVASRAIPIAAVALSLNQAAKATNDWRDSTNALKYTIGQTLAVFDSNPLKLLGEDQAAAARRHDQQNILNLSSKFNSGGNDTAMNQQVVQTIAQSYGTALDAANSKTDAFVLKQLQASGALENTDTAFKAYTDRLQTNITAEKSWTDVTGNKAKTIDGITYSQKAWDQALAQSNGDIGKAEGILEGHTTALYVNETALKQAADQQANLKQFLADTSAKYGLTTQQVDTYTAALGLNYTAIASSTAKEKEAVAVIGQVAQQLSNGNTAIQGWLSAVDSFEKSGDSLTSRADLLAAGLTALQGVTLSQAGANLTAVDATEKLATTLDQNKSSISSTGTLLGQLTKTAHGYVVEQPKLTAGSLAIQHAMANTGGAAIDLAKSIYQNTGNANEAYSAFEGLRTQFVSTETQSLHSADAANKLANQIFGIPKDAKTFVALLNKDNVATAIADLTTKLGGFSQIIATALIHLNQPDKPALDDTVAKLFGIDGKTFTFNLHGTSTGVTPPSTGSGAIGNILVPGGSNNPGYYGAGGPGAPHATGGYLDGPGTGTSDSLLIKASSGEFVMNARATAALRPVLEHWNKAIPAFASGGYVPPSLLVPSSSSSSASKKNVQASISFSEGTAYGIADVIAKNTPAAKHAMTDLTRAVNDAFDLKGVQKKLATVQGQLKQLQQDSASLRASVQTSLGGSVDVAKYADVGGLLDALGNQTGANSKFTSELNKLSREGVNKTLLQKLASAGPSAGLDTLAGASMSQIKQVNAAFGSYINSANAGGTFAATDVYGSRIAADQKLVTSLGAQAKHLENNIDKLVSVVAKMTGRPVEVKLDGKVLASAVFKSKEFDGVLDGISHALVYR